MTLDPAGRVALVTGAGSGIGSAIARTLARAGATVALLGRRAEPLLALATEIERRGGEALAVPCDITNAREREAALRLVAASMGPIEILINNAGAAHSGPLSKLDDADIDRLMLLNVEAPFALAGSVVPAMRTAGYGRIVNLASTAGLVGTRYTALYVATKHALLGWTRSLAAEVLPDGITVNAVCPGFVDTAIVDEAARKIAEKSGKAEAVAKDELARQNPLGRLVRPEEVAAAVLSFLGPYSGAMSGHALVLDGGTQPV